MSIIVFRELDDGVGLNFCMMVEDAVDLDIRDYLPSPRNRPVARAKHHTPQLPFIHRFSGG